MKYYQLLIAFTLLNLFAVRSDAQSVSFATGISKDIDNSKFSFYHVPLNLIWRPSDKKFSPLIEVNYSFSFTAKSNADAYTLNPALPAKVNLQENIKPDYYTAGFGCSIRLIKTKNNSTFNLNLIPFEFCHQNIRVKYLNYDRENYEVLNPDITLNGNSNVVAASIVYNFHKRKNDLMVMLHIQSPLSNSDNGYTYSYNPITPLQLTIGYNYYYKK